jgi:hypothetical protein
MIPSCITLTPEARELLTTQLAQAEAAYHTLQMGQAARVVVDQNGERVEFMSSNKGNLYNYIISLKAQLGMFSAACGGVPIRPAGFLF